MRILNWFFPLLLVLSACANYSDEEMSEYDKKIEQYIDKNNLEMAKSESGLYYHIIEEGEGDYIKSTALISVSYKGYLLDGTVFDEQKEPIELNLRQLIHGWREMAYYLKPGGKAHFIVPPQLGYGQKTMSNIPKNSVLVFEIEIDDAY